MPKVVWPAGEGLAGVCAATHTGLLRKGPLGTVLLWVWEPCKGCSHSPAPALVQPSTSLLPFMTRQWSPRASLPSCTLRKPASLLLSKTDHTEDRAVVVSDSQAAEQQLPPPLCHCSSSGTVGLEPWAPRKAGQFIRVFFDQRWISTCCVAGTLLGICGHALRPSTF